MKKDKINYSEYLEKVRARETETTEWEQSKQSTLIFPDYYIKSNLKILDAVQELLNNEEETSKSIILAGSVGSGKTELARIIAASVIPARFRTDKNYRWCNTFELWNEVKKMYGSNFVDKGEAVSKLMEITQFYILDDIGAEDETPASKSFVEQMILTAHKKFEQNRLKLLIITTNLGISDIEKRYSERVRSRIDEMSYYFSLRKQDYRKMKRRGVVEK